MYEFSEKEIRYKFKNTEYGKKTNKILIVSVIISVVMVLISCIVFFLLGAGNKDLTASQSMGLNILFALTLISVIFSCYFDGKRDGAIEQYKLDKKA